MPSGPRHRHGSRIQVSTIGLMPGGRRMSRCGWRSKRPTSSRPLPASARHGPQGRFAPRRHWRQGSSSTAAGGSSPLRNRTAVQEDARTRPPRRKTTHGSYSFAVSSVNSRRIQISAPVRGGCATAGACVLAPKAAGPLSHAEASNDGFCQSPLGGAVVYCHSPPSVPTDPDGTTRLSRGTATNGSIQRRRPKVTGRNRRSMPRHGTRGPRRSAPRRRQRPLRTSSTAPDSAAREFTLNLGKTVRGVDCLRRAGEASVFLKAVWLSASRSCRRL